MRKWDITSCRYDAKQCTTRREFQKRYPNSYAAARRNRWLNDICQHMVRVRHASVSWTIESIRQESARFQSKRAWRENSPASYQFACDHDWVKELSVHLTDERKQRPHKYSKNQIFTAAQQCESRFDFQKRFNTCYKWALRNGWLDECCAHMESCHWTISELTELAQRFSSRVDFWRTHPGAYKAAIRLGIFEQICSHMVLVGGTSHNEQTLLHYVQQYYPDAKSKRFGKLRHGTYGQRFELDVYVPELNKGIEFNGTYWHSLEGLRRGRPNWPEDMIRDYHSIKREFFRVSGIQYIEISDSDWHSSPSQCMDKINLFLAIRSGSQST